MPTPNNRPSLATTLDQRYANQREGGAFDVKQRLGPPGTSPAPGSTMPVDSQQAKQFLTPPGFVVKEKIGVTQMLDAIDANTSSAPRSQQLSLYLKGFDNRRYKK